MSDPIAAVVSSQLWTPTGPEQTHTHDTTVYHVRADTTGVLDGWAPALCAIATGLSDARNSAEDEIMDARVNMPREVYDWWQHNGLQWDEGQDGGAPFVVLRNDSLFADQHGHVYDNTTIGQTKANSLGWNGIFYPAYTSMVVFCAQEPPEFVLRDFARRCTDMLKERGVQLLDVAVFQEHTVVHTSTMMTRRRAGL